jgi:hypothetical protein
MHPIPELTPLLKQLRLSGILDSLEARNREAIDRQLAFTDFLSLLIHDEVARREQKKLDLRTVQRCMIWRPAALSRRRWLCSLPVPAALARAT